MGETIRPGNSDDVLASAFTPPLPAYKALVRSGL